jgi:4-hydroxyacetophenone monooxygenase
VPDRLAFTGCATSGTPFTTSDDEIAAALQDVSIPALLLSCLHMTGDVSLLDGPLRPAGLFLNEVQGYMSEEDKAAARALALDVIRDYRDRGCPEPAPVDAAQLKRMMDWLVCEDVPTSTCRCCSRRWNSPAMTNVAPSSRPPPQPADFPVVVIGCGMSGLLAAIRLQEAGIPYTVLEKNAAGVGGTWWENTYPGARVDVGNHFYCYSFEPEAQWTEFFARQPELQSYFQNVMERRGIDEHVRFNTRVTTATWDDDDATWSVEVESADAVTETLTARAVIGAVGQLNTPLIPEFEGAQSFSGPAFHSALGPRRAIDRQARRDDRRRRIGLPDRAGDRRGCQEPDDLPAHRAVDVPNPNYHEPVGDGVRWALEHLPFYARWYRFLLFWPGCDRVWRPPSSTPTGRISRAPSVRPTTWPG